MVDLAAHDRHETPLAHRIISDLIGQYITTAAGLASAATGNATPEEVAAQKAIDRMRYLHLAGWDYRLTPRIVDALTRAGLLSAPSPEPRP